MFMLILMNCISVISHRLMGRNLLDRANFTPRFTMRACDVVVAVGTQCHSGVSLVFQLSLGAAEKVLGNKKGFRDHQLNEDLSNAIDNTRLIRRLTLGREPLLP